MSKTDTELRPIIAAIQGVCDQLENLVTYGDLSPARLEILTAMQSALCRAVQGLS